MSYRELALAPFFSRSLVAPREPFSAAQEGVFVYSDQDRPPDNHSAADFEEERCNLPSRQSE